MKKLFFAVLCITTMLMAGTNLKAQEVSIELLPGWNWIAYPYCETVDLNTAFGSFTPMTGDILKSQYGSSSFRYGQWRGAVQSLNAGEGYHYFSNRTEPVILVFGLPSIPIGPLTVTTSEPTNITSTTAICGGSAVSNDSTSILMKGVCWAIHPQPTTNDSYSEDGNGPGDFTTTITELDPESIYYVRAYAVSVKGINYGEELSFTTNQAPPTIPEGAINGMFSVGDNQQVYFSQGNLQYQASTDIWRFAENQWDYMGYENANISPTYDGWIDLFGWGTSGWDNGNTYYHPWDSDNSNGTLYGPPGGHDLTGNYANADWGVYNSISNGGNQPGLWRTLTKSEWSYVLFNRSTASGIRYARATVNGVIGVILVPDDWSSSIFPLNNTNQGGANFNSNIIDALDWIVLESNGAVFLPITGGRGGVSISEIGSNPHGYYWSTTFTTKDFACYMYFWNYGVGMNYDDDGRAGGRCVRLVRSAENMTYYNINVTTNPAEGGTLTGEGNYAEGQTCTLIATANNGYTFANWMENDEVVSTNSTYSFIVEENRNLVANFTLQSNIPTGAINGLFSVSEDSQVYFSQGNLQYQASTGIWRFAENQHDIIGNANSNISPVYDGWIDLFGWGTSGYDNKYPWMTSEIETDYGDNQNNIAYTEYDWGQHNPISNGGNQAGLWRTLSSAEMNYMIYQRPNASNLYAMGLVNGRHGLIIFPDNFEVPNGMSFTPAYKLWSNDINNYSLNQWSMLEANGAVFLPVAGVRNGMTVSEEDESGYYWSTDILTPEEGAKEMWFGRMYIYYNPGIGGWASRHVGYSVRLVTDAE